MKKIIKCLILISLFFCSNPLHPQDKTLYKWMGDWESISGYCPHFCIQRKFTIERKGLPAINANLVLSHINYNGSNMQFLVLNRQYLWIKEYYDVTCISHGNYFIADAFNQSEAIRYVMDDAVRSYLREEGALRADLEKRDSSSSQSNKENSSRKELVTEGERKQFIKDSIRILLDKGEAYIAQHNYEAALSQVKLAIEIEKNLNIAVTPDVLEMEKRVTGLMKERDDKIAADKKKQNEADAQREERKNKKLDKKVLFAGNPGNKPYPNPYDNPDPDRVVHTSPFEWKDYPGNIKDEPALKKMYDDAVRNHDGYRLLQLAKIRYLTGIHFAEMKDILPKVHDIARFNRDPWLMYHMADFYSNLHAFKYLPEFPGVYLKEAYDISILRNNAASLYKIYHLEKNMNLIPDMTGEDILKTRDEMME